MNWLGFEGQGVKVEGRSLQGQIFALLRWAEAPTSTLGRQSMIMFLPVTASCRL